MTELQKKNILEILVPTTPNFVSQCKSVKQIEFVQLKHTK